VRRNFFCTRSVLFILVAVLLVLAALPLMGLPGYRLRLLSLVFMWVALSGCWNLMSGYTGYIDFGPVAYFGVGSYCTSLLMIKGGFPFFLSILLSGSVCALLALAIGTPTLKLRGAYFAIATFAAAEAMKQIILEWDHMVGFEFFGGAHGLTLPLPPSNEFFYYTLLFFMGLVLGLTALLERSKFGYGLRAIHEAEPAAELAGVPTLTLKVRAYILSSSLIGCIGGVEAYWLTYIIPDDVFNVLRTIQMVVMTLLGGMGTLLGPVIGATFLTLISEFLGAKFIYNYLIFLGIIVVAIIILMPRGIMGAVQRNKGWPP